MTHFERNYQKLLFYFDKNNDDGYGCIFLDWIIPNQLPARVKIIDEKYKKDVNFFLENNDKFYSDLDIYIEFKNYLKKTYGIN